MHINVSTQFIKTVETSDFVFQGLGLGFQGEKNSVFREAYILSRLLSGFFQKCSDLRESFIASKVCNQPAIWSVMFNDSSKHRLVVSGTCGHLLKLLEATLCGDKKRAQ